MLKKQVFNDTEVNRDISLLFCGMEHCSSTHSFTGRRDHHIIHYITGGEGTLQIKGKVTHLKAGDAFIIYPMQKNRYAANPANPYRYRWIAFTGIAVNEILRQFGIIPDHQVLPGIYSSSIEKLFTETFDVLNAREFGYTLKATSILYDILWQLTRERSKQPVINAERINYAKTAKQFIHTNYATNINVNDIAKHLGIHRGHLSRLFQEEEKVSILDYLIRYRVEKSKEYLTHNDDPIADVAASVGYPNYFTFAKRFHQVTGYTPTQYRHTFRLRDPHYYFEDHDR